MPANVPTIFGLTGRALHIAQVNTFPEIDTIHTIGKLRSHNSTSKGGVIDAFQIGDLFGAHSPTFFSDRIGRRKTIFLGAVLTIIGQVLPVASYGIIQFTIGRILLDAGVGLFSVAIPVRQSESSAAKNRGSHVIIDGLCMSSGYALCNWIDFGLSRVPESSTQWRVPLALSLPSSLMILLSVFLFPEPPRWLVQVNRIKRAEQSLAILKGNEATEEEIRVEMTGIHTSLKMTAHSRGSLMESLKKDEEERLFYRNSLL